MLRWLVRLGLVLVVVLGAGAAMVVRPTGAPDYTVAPPELWEDGYVEHTTEALINMPRDEFQAWFKENPLASFLKPVGSIPLIERTVMLEGEWFTDTGKRRVEFVTGDTAVERVLEFTPEVFRYQIWGFTTPARYAVDHVHGRIVFEPEGEGQTRVIWTYRIAPKAFFMRPMVESAMTREYTPFMEAGLTAMAAAANGG
jgi:hypothetical protein